MFLLIVIYLSFISLGLPDSLLGTAWPIIHQEFNVNLSQAAIISMIISVATIASSVSSIKLIRRLGTGKLTALSVILSAFSLFGFSMSQSLVSLCVWAIPYGLAAGAVDAALNQYVALHYSAMHMSWLHSFWGVGASLSPMIMGLFLSLNNQWRWGYGFVAIVQTILALIVLSSLKEWNDQTDSHTEHLTTTFSIIELVKSSKGLIPHLLTFLVYCSIESTAGLWASSFLVASQNFPVDKAAFISSLFYYGLTGGRLINGFLTHRFNDKQLVRIGSLLMLLACIIMTLSSNKSLILIGFVVLGFGCAPIYPSVIHATPTYFGKSKSQMIIGIEMAVAYTGATFLPVIFGNLIRIRSINIYPMFLLFLVVSMIIFAELTHSKVKK